MMCFRVNLEVANVYVHIPLQKLSLQEAREWSLLQLENNLVVCAIEQKAKYRYKKIILREVAGRYTIMRQ